MAGIGFELKKLFRRKGLFASLRAYGYAGIICTGPMLLGVLLQLGILLLCSWAGAPRDQQDLLVCMITYTLLFEGSEPEFPVQHSQHLFLCCDDIAHNAAIVEQAVVIPVFGVEIDLH